MEDIDLLILLNYLKLNQRDEAMAIVDPAHVSSNQQSLLGKCMQSTGENLLLVNLQNLNKSRNCKEKKTVLTGKDCCEENVVRKRNESTFPKCIKYAVFISKLLPLLRQLLFVHPTPIPKRENKAIS